MRTSLHLTLTVASIACIAAVSRLQADQTLVPSGAVWKFLDDGSNQGTGWRDAGFDDSIWNQGPAELGYGDGDESTLVGFGGNSSNKYITTYFRKSFTVADPSAFLSLKLRLLRDDGAVVYLNGTEVRRDNLPAGSVSPTTLASSAVADAAEDTFYDSTLPTSSLLPGTNTLAVEVHQSGATSSDISFNLELIGLDSINVTRGPYLQLATPTSLIVRWRTDTPTIGRVTYGTSLGSVENSVSETVSTTEHQLQLTGLQPGTRYYYAIGTPALTHASGEAYSFRTPPTPGTIQPTRVWILGDSGTADANALSVANAYAAFTQSIPTDVWLMLGDNAYESGTDAEFQAAVFDMYPGFLRQTALWSTLGNHETYASPDATPYFQIHNFPTGGEAGGAVSGTEKYYSFDHANIHFICLDSMLSSRAVDNQATASANEDGPMAAWLRADLESTVQEWIIAFWHHPPYSKGSHNSDTEAQLIEMRTNFLPILEAGGVDLVLAGHSHSYERTHLLDGHYGLSSSLTSAMVLDAGGGRESGAGAYQKPADNAAHQGAVYITAGSSGKISGGTLNHPAMYLSLNNLGSLVLDVNGPRLDARFLRETGAVADSFTILKSVPNQPPSVSLTSPASPQTLPTGTPISLTASATDADGTIAQVAFYAGTTFLGSDTTAPYEFLWTPTTPGTYPLSAAAQDNLGATSTSTEVTVVIENPVPDPPAAPATLGATAGNTQIQLSWTVSAGATSYTLYRSQTIDGIYSPLASGLTTTTHLDTGLANGTTYFYVVTASNAGGESPASPIASATPTAPPQPPAAPSGLTATAVSKSQINLAWTDNSSNETGFKIEQKSGKNSWAVIATAGANQTTFAVTGLGAGKTVTFRVRATNQAGDSAASNEASATTPRR